MLLCFTFVLWSLLLPSSHPQRLRRPGTLFSNPASDSYSFPSLAMKSFSPQLKGVACALTCSELSAYRLLSGEWQKSLVSVNILWVFSDTQTNPHAHLPLLPPERPGESVWASTAGWWPCQSSSSGCGSGFSLTLPPLLALYLGQWRLWELSLT